MDLKTLIVKEQEERRERMINETSGMYILLYLGVGFSVFASGMFGFHFVSGDFQMIITLSVINIFAYEALSGYSLSVKENGIRTNIFAKYVYAPIEPKKLVWAKFIVSAKKVVIVMALSQLAAVLVRAIDPDKDGGSFADASVWQPLINGIIFLILYGINCRIQLEMAISED